MTAVYLHIPFCRSRCPYCDFVSEACPGHVPEEYVDALCREAEAAALPTKAKTIFIGGGTPSLLAPESLTQLLATLHDRFQHDTPELTLEANPDDVTPELVRHWRDAGVNRLSLGVQSFDDHVLRYLGRRHDANTARRACALVAEAFDNWNMDLIFGGYPLEAWPATLAQARQFDPPHISAYGLTYESGTPFGERSTEAANDDVSLALYQQTESVLDAYAHYEVSNYAKPGFQCRHNLVYWHNEEYLGLGTGAYSFIDGVRARNLCDTREYMAHPGKKAEQLRLSPQEIRLETLIQHLRLREGLPKAYYTARFGTEAAHDFTTALDELKARGLLEEDATHLRPTAQGFYLNNEIGLALV